MRVVPGGAMTRANAVAYAGVEVGADAILAALMTSDGRVLARSWRLPPGSDYARLCRLIGELIAECRVGVPMLSLARVTVATVAPFDQYGRLLGPDLRPRPFQSDLSELLRVPVRLERTARAAALAEVRDGVARTAEGLLWV